MNDRFYMQTSTNIHHIPDLALQERHMEQNVHYCELTGTQMRKNISICC
jgi:hypothetical protein